MNKAYASRVVQQQRPSPHDAQRRMRLIASQWILMILLGLSEEFRRCSFLRVFTQYFPTTNVYLILLNKAANYA